MLPATIQKFRKHGDEASAALLEFVIYPEEVTHCAAGVRWFTHLHDRGEHASAARASAEVANGRGEEGREEAEVWGGHLRVHAVAEEAEKKTEEEEEEEEEQEEQDRQPVVAAVVVRKEKEKVRMDAVVVLEKKEGRGCEEAGEVIAAAAAVAAWGAVAGAGAAGAGAGGGAGVDVVAGIPPGASLLDRFHAIVRHHFRGVLKPPFNDEARARAGFGPEWYMPLTARLAGVAAAAQSA